MKLQDLKVKSFRNIKSADLELNPEVNLFYGANGSGKTSLLEAIHFLSARRSFRSHLINRIVNHEATSFSLFANYLTDDCNTKVGIEWREENVPKVRINGRDAQGVSELAKIMPLQLINPASFDLLVAGPKIRRQFLDWGVFHVEHLFFPAWKQLSRILQQRNAALRAGVREYKELEVWDRDFCRIAQDITESRQKYFEQFCQQLTPVFSQLLDFAPPKMTLYQGWSTEQSLSELLQVNFPRDKVLQYTQFGPQRADIKMNCGKVPTKDVLSRGQQKMLVIALRIAQGWFLEQKTNKKCAYLIDDLASELSYKHRELVLNLLMEKRNQLFLTAIEKNDIAGLLQNGSTKVQMFHVEHGCFCLRD